MIDGKRLYGDSRHINLRKTDLLVKHCERRLSDDKMLTDSTFKFVALTALIENRVASFWQFYNLQSLAIPFHLRMLARNTVIPGDSPVRTGSAQSEWQFLLWQDSSPAILWTSSLGNQIRHNAWIIQVSVGSSAGDKIRFCLDHSASSGCNKQSVQQLLLATCPQSFISCS
jgi:hypothetical protein